MKKKDKVFTVALAGNPNSGKTTLFNGLTGGKQQIGNWPGVTVEMKEGFFKHDGKDIRVVDIPGVYSMSTHSEDEKVARDYILGGEVDLIVNIIDSTNIERNLYLTTQLLEMNIPVLVLLNRSDLAKKENILVDEQHLSEHIDAPVYSMSAIRKKDVNLIKEVIAESYEIKAPKVSIGFDDEIEKVVKKWSPKLTKISETISADSRWIALKVLEGDSWITGNVVDANLFTQNEIDSEIEKIESILDESMDILLADYRFGFINGLVRDVVRKVKDRQKLTDKIDRFVLNRFLGLPIFLGVMYFMFWVAIVVGGAFIDFFDIAFGTVFVDGFGHLLNVVGSPEWLTAILAGGVGAGIQTVATFIPIIFAMFFMLSLLEDSGYMARAAFVMDRFMRYIGLPGKSFVPMIIGFGCTVPAVMATRTLETRKDRILTIFMTPFMSCGARLPVYVLFAAVFFPARSGFIVFSLYLIGMAMAILTGLLLKKTIYKGEASHFVMELPIYNPPRIKHIMIHTWHRLKEFIFRAGRVIVIVVAILAFLNSVGTDGTFGNENKEKSVLASIGKTITPIFAPMGIEEKNWPASVALFTGIFAKEAVVGTLNSLYGQMAMKQATENANGEETSFSLTAGFGEAFSTIPANLSGIFDGLKDPLGMGIVSEAGDSDKIAEEFEVEKSVFPLIREYFSQGAGQVYAYLLFILLYFPCVAALGAIVREVGRGVAMVQVTYITVLGWVTATLFYQFTIGHSVVWIGFSFFLLALMIIGFKIYGLRVQGKEN